MIKTAKSMITLSILFAVMAAMTGITPMVILGAVSAFFWNMYKEEEEKNIFMENDLWERDE